MKPRICSKCGHEKHPRATNCLVCAFIRRTQERVKQFNAIDGLTAADVWRRYEDQKHHCFWCGVYLPDGVFVVDHMLSMSKGGSNIYENTVITCLDCNTRKNDRDPIAFASECNVSIAPFMIQIQKDQARRIEMWQTLAAPIIKTILSSEEWIHQSEFNLPDGLSGKFVKGLFGFVAEQDGIQYIGTPGNGLSFRVKAVERV